MEKDLSTLKHLHAELLDTLRNYFNYPFYSNDARIALIYKLVSGTELDDADYTEALEDGTALQLVDSFLDDYNTTELLNWLVRHSFDLFYDYRNSNREYRENFNDEEWAEICDNSLVYNENVAVVSW